MRATPGGQSGNVAASRPLTQAREIPGSPVITSDPVSDRRDRYRRNGYLYPLDLFDATAVSLIRAEFDRAESDARDRDLKDQFPLLIRANAQYVLPFVHRVATTPALLDAVEEILGPDLMLWSAEFFIKPARSGKIVSWHQDLTYWGLGETDDEITAWIALSDVTVESGCMRFLPGSHRLPIQPHKDSFDEANLLSRGQVVAMDVNEDETVNVTLKPGQVSLHHGRMFHASGPNRSEQDRVGLVFRFITPSVRQLVAKQDYAMLVRGEDRYGHWILQQPPIENFSPGDLERHERIRRDQSDALAEGAARSLHAAY